MIGAVGLASYFGFGRRGELMPSGAAARSIGSPTTRIDGVVSPWNPDDVLAKWTVDELWTGLSDLVVDRQTAMRVPAVARCRHLIAETGARAALHAYAGDVELEPGPTWTYRTDGPVSPYHRMLWTLDDLLFYGWSLWAVDRGADGFVIAADRVPFDLWEFDRAGQVLIGGENVPGESCVLIPGPHEGILAFGARTIRAAAAAEDAYTRTARNPVPSIELHQTEGLTLDDDEIDALIARWAAARAGANGGVAFTSPGVEAKTHGVAAEQLLIEGRNSSAVDVARMAGLPASLIDANTVKASLTYETALTRNAEFIDYGLQAYTDPVSARLSQDDVVPRGTRVAFDLTSLTSLAGPTGEGPSSLD